MNISLLLAIIPSCILGSYIYKKDLNKEPSSLLAKLLLSGVASVLITLLISYLMDYLFPAITSTENATTVLDYIIPIYIGVGLVEEFSKWIMVKTISYNDKEFDELYDMIVYSAFVSLGFATLENILYVITNEAPISTAILRGFLSVPTHACLGVYMGYFIGISKFESIKDSYTSIKYMLYGLIVPTILHGTYDYIIMCSPFDEIFFSISFIIYAIILFANARKIVKSVSKEGKRVKEITPTIIEPKTTLPNFCPKCGSRIGGNYNFCTRCGNKVR